MKKMVAPFHYCYNFYFDLELLDFLDDCDKAGDDGLTLSFELFDELASALKFQFLN
jgi:hypothetical protein